MGEKSALSYLKNLYRSEDDTSRRGTSLKRALLSLALPAAAGLATACYGMPMEDYYTDMDTPDPEICSNGIDDDYDGLTDCADPECERLEYCLGCLDGIDNDGDGRADCADASCADLEICASPNSCSDEEDNDADGWSDCSDPDCADSDDCA